MKPDLIRLLRSPADERVALFEAAAANLKTQARNVEKDLYVCWLLDVLFNGKPDDGMRLYFKEAPA